MLLVLYLNNIYLCLEKQAKFSCQSSDYFMFATARGYAMLDWAYLAIKLTHTVFFFLQISRYSFGIAA